MSLAPTLVHRYAFPTREAIEALLGDAVGDCEAWRIRIEGDEIVIDVVAPAPGIAPTLDEVTSLRFGNGENRSSEDENRKDFKARTYDSETSNERAKSDASATPELKGGPLARRAAIACGERGFWTFLGVTSTDAAKADVCRRCGIKTRKMLDHDARAAGVWNDIDGKYRLGDIDNAMMARAANALYPGRAPATIRRHLYVPMSAIINFVKDDKLRAPKGGGARTMFVMPSLAEAIIQAATTQPSPWLPALITFLFGQGTRTGETFAIDGRDDISLAGRWAILRDPKNGHERRVTLQSRVVAALSVLPNIGDSGPLFRRFDGKAFAEKIGRGGQIRTAFARAVESGGGDPRIITPHICRHSWATWFYSQTKDTLRLKEEGGWLSNEHQRYVKLGTPEIGAEAFAKGWDFKSAGENWGNVVALVAKTSA